MTENNNFKDSILLAPIEEDKDFNEVPLSYDNPILIMLIIL